MYVFSKALFLAINIAKINNCERVPSAYAKDGTLNIF